MISFTLSIYPLSEWRQHWRWGWEAPPLNFTLIENTPEICVCSWISLNLVTTSSNVCSAKKLESRHLNLVLKLVAWQTARMSPNFFFQNLPKYDLKMYEQEENNEQEIKKCQNICICYHIFKEIVKNFKFSNRYVKKFRGRKFQTVIWLKSEIKWQVWNFCPLDLFLFDWLNRIG